MKLFFRFAPVLSFLISIPVSGLAQPLIIGTIAGTGRAGFSGDGGPATLAQLRYPKGIAIGPSGNLYIVDSDNNRVREVTPDGMIRTVAGTGAPGAGGDGGPAVSAQLNFPYGIARDAAGNLYIADHGNHRVRMVTADGKIS